MAENSPRASIFSVQRMSTEDGPGIRTTVFFEGCSLACDWCHNPESIDRRPRAIWHDWKCMGCSSCIATCEHGAIVRTGEGMRVLADRCAGCGACCEACPTTAMEPKAVERGLGSLLDEVARDRAYYDSSGGGVTVSGGEPTLQAPFVQAFLEGCQAAGLHTALDTCGHCGAASLERLLPHTDLVLYDLKLMDPDAHRRHTGHGLERILGNLEALFGQRTAAPPLWIRTPLIPGVTATPAVLQAIGQFLAERLEGRVLRWELCAFNNLCQDKYQRLGLEWPYRGQASLARAELEDLAAVARGAGLDPALVHLTGPGVWS
jgi:pyruvate formate lyase activating enzyme